MRLGTVIVESMLHAHRMGAGIRVGIVNDKDASRNGWVLTIFGQLDLQLATYISYPDCWWFRHSFEVRARNYFEGPMLTEGEI